MAALSGSTRQRLSEEGLEYVPPPGAIQTPIQANGQVREPQQTGDRLREGLADATDIEHEQGEEAGEEDVADQDDQEEEEEDEDQADTEPRRSTRRRRKRRRTGRRRGRSRRTAAMFRGSSIDWLAIFLIRLGVWGLLAGTFLGSAFAMHGGTTAVGPLIPAFDWNAPWQPLAVLFLWPSLLGMSFQIVLTLIQWHHRQRKRSPWYLGAILLDSTLSYFGWRDLLVPFFERVYTGLGWPLPQVLAHGTVALLALAVAVIPEVFLLDG